MTSQIGASPRAVPTDEPWLGLESYTEEDATLFYGREAETEELFRLLRREVLTVVFGPSGTGKTSLLQAGLFPRLLNHYFFPVPVRLDYSTANTGLVMQIRAAVAQALTRYQIDEESLDEALAGSNETLWEYFHRTQFWDRRNNAVTPVIVIDQFEEIFTLGRNHAGAGDLLNQLADLVENYIPAAVRDRLEQASQTLHPRASEQRYKLIVALREDFVSRLDGLRKMMPSVMHNRFALTRLNGKQALRPVLLPGAGIVSEPVAEQIVRKVASADPQIPLEELSIDPALLSLMCRELNNRRLRAHLDTIPADLVNSAASNILSDFYDRAFAGLNPAAREFVEDRLLTADGFRTTVARHAAVQQGLEADVDVLVNRRVLRSEERLGLPHLELTHDVLTRVARSSRDLRVERQRQAEEGRRRAQEESSRRAELARTRRSLAIVGLAGVVCLLLAIVAFQSYRSAARSLEVATAAEQDARAQRDRAEASARDAIVARDQAQRLSVEARLQTDEANRQKALVEESRAQEEAQRLVAVAKSEEALARQLAAQSQTVARARSALPLSTLLSVESMRRYLSFDADQALRANVALLPRQLEQIVLGPPESYRGVLSSDGRVLVSVGDRGIQVWNLDAKKQTGVIETVDPANTLAISSDGSRIAASTSFRPVDVFDSSGKSLAPKPLPPADVLAWSGDNRYLATAGPSPVTTVFDTSSFTSVPLVHKGLQQSLSGPVRAVVFSPDGKMVAIARRNVVGVWQVPGWTQIAEVTHDGGELLGLAFSPNGEQIAAASNGQAQVWRTPSMTPSARFAIPPAQYFQSMTLRFDPSGRFIAVAASGGGVVWQLGDAPVERLTMRHDALIRGLAFSADGTYVAAGGGGAASVYNVKTGLEVGRMTHPPDVVGLGFAHDGRTLVTVAADNTARWWEPEGFSRRAIVPLEGGLQTTTFTNRNEAIVSGDRFNRSVRVVNVRDGATVGSTYEAAVATGDQLLVAQRIPSGLLIRDLRNSKIVTRLEHPALTQKTVQKGRVSTNVGLEWVKFSPDGRYLCAVGTETPPQLWDVRASRRIDLPKLFMAPERDRAHREVAFSPDASLVAIRGSRNAVDVYSLPAGRHLAQLGVDTAGYALTFSPDGRYLAVLDGFYLWDVRALQKPMPHTNTLGTLQAVFSPNGRFLAHLNTVWTLPDRVALRLQATPEQFTFDPHSTIVAAQDGRTVTLWHLEQQRQLARLVHNDSDSAVAFSHDGKYVATTDGAIVRVWKTDGSEVARIEHLSRVSRVVFSPDGDLISFARVTSDGPSALHVLPWRAEQIITEACQRLTRNLDPAEWREYIGGEKYRKTCPNLP